MKHAAKPPSEKRRRKNVADSGAAVGEMRWAVTVYPLFSLQAGGAKKKFTKRNAEAWGSAPSPARGF